MCLKSLLLFKREITGGLNVNTFLKTIKRIPHIVWGILFIIKSIISASVEEFRT